MLVINNIRKNMSDLIKKEIVSTVKWLFLIFISASAYFFVSPKYQPINEDQLRLNSITGQVFKPAKKKETRYFYPNIPDKNKNVFENILIIESENGFWFIEDIPKKETPEGYHLSPL